MTVGEKIRQRRESINMSQEELAKRMGYKDRSSISKIEKGSDKNLSLETVQKIAEILNCSPLFLMGWSEDEKHDAQLSPQEEKFIERYHRLDAYSRSIVENMIEALASKQ